MDANEPVEVCTTKDVSEAELLKNLLEREGIQCRLEGEGQASLAGVLDIKVLVRAWDEERARQVLTSPAYCPTGRPRRHGRA